MSANASPKPGWTVSFASNSGFAAALIATGWLVPAVAGAASVAAYLSAATVPTWIPYSGEPAVVIGVVLGIVAWLMLSLIYTGFANARNANRGSYGELLARVNQLRARIDACQEMPGTSSGTACAEARSHAAYLEQELTTAGPRWVDGTGYIAAWERLHRAEEVLFEVESRSDLLADAVYDELRLNGSTVEHSDQLLALIAAAKQYLRQHVLAVAALVQRGAMASNGSDQVNSEVEARSSLREVRGAINMFRDGSWEGIVRARNQLVRGVVLAEVAAYGFLVLAIVGKAPTRTIEAAVAFFAMGAVIGLFNRVATLVATDTAVEDYSLSTARLITTPVFAGLAAVIGVYLVGTLYNGSLASVTQPGGGSGAPVTIPTLVQIYDLRTFPIGLLVAAVFGLVPTLVIDRLQRLADSYKEDIKRSEPAAATPARSQ